MAKYRYEAFGEIREESGSARVSNVFTFTGREYDKDSGLYYYRARYYNGNTGRFLQRDPVGEGLYVYCVNNPINWIDPEGLWRWYGNWGGPGWSSGDRRSERHQLPQPGDSNYVAPIDEQDACYERHDRCISCCPVEKQRECIRNCDYEVSSCLNRLEKKTFRSKITEWSFRTWIPRFIH